MAKPKSFLLVGLPHTGVPLLTAALEQHRDALAELGVTAPAKSADEAFRAAVELRREHRAWGAAAQGRRGHLERDLPPGPQAAADRRRRPRAARRRHP